MEKRDYTGKDKIKSDILGIRKFFRENYDRDSINGSVLFTELYELEANCDAVFGKMKEDIDAYSSALDKAADLASDTMGDNVELRAEINSLREENEHLANMCRKLRVRNAELPSDYTGWAKCKSGENWMGYYHNGRLKYGINCCEDWFDWDVEVRVNKSDDYAATDEEVERALIKEAKKRGYKDGVRIKSMVSGGERFIEGNDMDWGKNLGVYRLKHGDYHIFKNGKWAEIIETISKKDAEKELGKKIID